ncbi:TadE/TadG family type IV pilus assembly protein [Pseudooctadecabacter sp.]|uniref:TadE/TadG family type IV pilus assembly protein n=1 Tax=Pseudooctadecabacter sp. TaxID=1966338 RepID=UPI0035C7B646
MSFISRISRFRRADDGAALVEFAFVLPLMLLIFAVIIEGSRTFWAYQTTIAGVRDATRFIARAEASDICETGGGLTQWTARAGSIVRQSQSGTDLFPSTISVTSVIPTLACISGNYAMGTVPVATVTAQLEIDYPFAGVFSFFDLSLPKVTTVISDTGRIFGT